MLFRDICTARRRKSLWYSILLLFSFIPHLCPRELSVCMHIALAQGLHFDSIVAESVIKSSETMARMSGATVNSSPVNNSSTSREWEHKRLHGVLTLELQII